MLFETRHDFIKHNFKEHSYKKQPKNSTRHQCAQCDRNYSRLNDLRKHINSVHENKKLKCTWAGCHQLFTQLSVAYRHVEKQHLANMPLQSNLSLKKQDKKAWVEKQ